MCKALWGDFDTDNAGKGDKTFPSCYEQSRRSQALLQEDLQKRMITVIVEIHKKV